MTTQKAINVMEKYTDITISKVVIEAHNMAITALSKQLPKAVEVKKDYAYCPICGEGQDYPGNIALDIKSGKHVYCYNCGQALTEDCCIICHYNTGDFVCRAECSGCDGHSKYVFKWAKPMK